MYKKYIKRILDVVLSMIAIPLILILTVFVGTAIYLEDHGTVFYRAERRGLYGKVFKMYKFRSMKMNAPDLRNKDNSTFNSDSDPRVTKVGRILRKASIDELPQFFNVFWGDMSVIGPRPITQSPVLQAMFKHITDSLYHKKKSLKWMPNMHEMFLFV